MKLNYYKLSVWALIAGFAGCQSDSVISKSQVALSGVEIGQKKQDVINTLGTPRNVTKLEGHQDILFEYEHLSVTFFDGEVDELYTDDRAACTTLNVCPGSSLRQLKATYGPAPTKYENGKKILTYGLSDSDCWIEFLISGDSVAAMNAKCPV